MDGLQVVWESGTYDLWVDIYAHFSFWLGHFADSLAKQVLTADSFVGFLGRIMRI